MLASVVDAGKPLNAPELVAALSTPPSERTAAVGAAQVESSCDPQLESRLVSTLEPEM